jgi:hypothetical protein
MKWYVKKIKMHTMLFSTQKKPSGKIQRAFEKNLTHGRVKMQLQSLNLQIQAKIQEKI